MTAIQHQLLPTTEGVADLMRELSPRSLALDLECLERLIVSLVRGMSAGR